MKISSSVFWNRCLSLLRISLEPSEAVTELNWIAKHVYQASSPLSLIDKKIERMCFLRGAKHMPLQYLLGSQPFGSSLDIKCQPGVLIPRWETEEWAIKICREIKTGVPLSSIKIADLCTGSGCLALIFSQHLENCEVSGIDISLTAIRLAQENLVRNARSVGSHGSISFSEGDIFELIPGKTLPKQLDLIVSNPPYVSECEYNSNYHTELSVRRYEPRLALVGGVEFYQQIFNIAELTNSQAVVCEIGGQEQLNEMAKVVSRTNWILGAMCDSHEVVRTVIGIRRTSVDWLVLSNLFDLEI
ncbi:S-adenosyl-L-methionine-dependent methyltransferase [Lipomyces oligophaga]|uniref:S-adenosyl-L-methionine-dependent methyltransferase n=1 Tax=Lipomyces oligophaga TaxID=45792 RepID=UPI0034CD736A